MDSIIYYLRRKYVSRRRRRKCEINIFVWLTKSSNTTARAKVFIKNCERDPNATHVIIFQSPTMHSGRDFTS